MKTYLDKFYPKTKTDERYVWWRLPDDDDGDDGFVEQTRASSLLSCAQSLEMSQAEIHQQNLWSAQLYSNRELAAFDWGSGQLYKASLSPITRTGENITVRVVDTLVSQIAKNKTKPKPTARGAAWSVRNQIRLLDKFLYGEFQRNQVYAKGKQVFRDACVFGFGAMEVAVEDDDEMGARVCFDRVFPDEILIDQMELVACGKIRHFYRRRVLPLEVIASTYNLDEEQLTRLGDSQETFSYLDSRPVGAGWAVVVTGYQVGPNGRWMSAANGVVLDEGPWDHDWIPYVFYHWQTPLSGFYSSSAVEQTIPYQVRLNEINEVIRDAQDIMGRPRLLIAEGSKVNPLDVDNVIGRFIKYTGVKPEAVTWPAINAELYNERERCVSACLNSFGLSDYSTTVTPPPGARFDSSPALREFNATQDDRLSDPSERLQAFYENLAKMTCKVIEASGANPKTTWYSGYKNAKSEVIDWADLEHNANDYIMTMESTSLYSMSPAAARDELEKQLAMGLITPEQYRLELCDPDQESEYSIQAAASKDLRRVQEVLETGEYDNPIPEQDLVNGVQLMTLELLNLSNYKDDGKGKVRLVDVKMNFINWIAEAKAILEKATEPDAQTQASIPPPPMDGSVPSQAMPSAPQPTVSGPMSLPVPEAAGLAVAQPGRAPTTSR